MIGAFVQLNLDSPRAASFPIGYVVCENGCWEWVGYCRHWARDHDRYCQPDGYGHYLSQMAHRWVYILLRGPIPNGLTLDHLCRNHRCVNPDHLEPVTKRDNTLRGTNQAAKRAKQTHCQHGHLLSGDNLLRQRLTGRRCRTCRQNREQGHSQYRPWCSKCGKKYAHGCPIHS